MPASLMEPEPARPSSPESDQPTPVADRSTPGLPDQSRPEQPDQTAAARAESPARTHIVRERETLSAISMQYYGTPNRWQKIVDANKDILKDPNKIRPGTKLTIPD